MKSELRFSAGALGQERIERLSRLTSRTPAAAGRTLVLLTVAAAGGALYGARPPTPVRDGPVAVVRGLPVIADTVLVILDVSGSMDVTGTEEKLASLFDALQASGMTVGTVPALGFGVSTAGWEDNLLHVLDAALQARPDVDAAYVFSDFQYIDEPIDGSDSAGYREVLGILRERGVRMYLGSVRYKPPTGLMRIARRTGGGVMSFGASPNLNGP